MQRIEKLAECQICSGHYHMMREHCPYCGARRVFIGSHSYERYEMRIVERDSAQLGLDFVRAIRSDLAFATL